MDCRTARLLLDYSRPRSKELEAGEVEALETHLAGCSECDALARAERRADEHLGRAVRDVPLPDGLRERIVARLGREQGARRRRVLARTARLAAAAAVLGFAAWLGYTFYPKRLPEFPVAEARDDKFLMMGANRDRVQEWLDGQGNGLVAPPQFNYALLSYYVMEERQGQRVPLLVFVNGQHNAFVYVISGKQFDLEALFRDKPVGSGGQSVELLRGDADHPHVAYAVIYTGESLRPFLIDSALHLPG
jgi:hypothetical protein